MDSIQQEPQDLPRFPKLVAVSRPKDNLPKGRPIASPFPAWKDLLAQSSSAATRDVLRAQAAIHASNLLPPRAGTFSSWPLPMPRDCFPHENDEEDAWYEETLLAALQMAGQPLADHDSKTIVTIIEPDDNDETLP